MIDLPSPGIAALLPYPEHFGPEHAGAIALKVRDETLASRYADRIRVLGRPIPLPYTDVRFRPLRPVLKRLLGRNLGMAERLRREVRGRTDVLIELHNRPHLVRFFKTMTPALPLVLHLHNDPTTMRGARTPAERRRLLQAVEAVVCVSTWVRGRFLQDLESGGERVHVVRNASRLADLRRAKEPLILFVGRMIAEKGVLELTEALVEVLPRHPAWRARLIAPTRFGRRGGSSAYRERVLRVARGGGGRIEHLGFLHNELVLEQYARAAVVVVPSVWPEPLSRTAVEALAHGCAVIASERGGLPEVIRGRGLLLEEPTAEQIAAALDRVLTDDDLRQDLQTLARQDFPFTLEAAGAALDAVRAPILARLEEQAALPPAA